MSILFQSVKVIDSQSKFNNKTVDVLVNKGVIESIGKNIEPPKKCKIIHGKGLHLSPGLMDLHVNYRDPGFDWKEDLNTGIQASAKGGFTSVLYMPSNNPSTNSKVQVDYIRNATLGGMVDVIPAGNITVNNKGDNLTELFEMNQSGAKAFTDDRNSVQKADVMKLALLYSKNFNGVVMNQPNDKTISSDGKMNEGIVSTKLGLKGIPALAEEVMLARDIELAEYTQAKLHTSRISTKKSVDMIRAAKKKGINITADVAIHNLILKDEDCATFDSNYKVFPPLRTSTDIDALLEGLKDGTIDAICSDHCPEDVEHKILTFDNANFGIIGAQSVLPLACELQKKLGLQTIIDALTHNPRRLLGIESPIIEEGTEANLCCFSTSDEWTFDEESIVSKSKNTPFLNRTFKTKVWGTVKGKQTTF
jgi:dihydroorotase